MNSGLTLFFSARRHIVPVVLAFRLISLTSSPSLALAATLPTEGEPIMLGSALLTLPDASYTQVSAQDFLIETNQVRVAAGLEPLTLNNDLMVAAGKKANDMIANNYWDHFRPADKKAPWDFIKESGYDYHYAGENLARGFKTAAGITQAWMESPSHRANLLSPLYTEVGFATELSTDESGETVLLSVQMFAAP